MGNRNQTQAICKGDQFSYPLSHLSNHEKWVLLYFCFSRNKMCLPKPVTPTVHQENLRNKSLYLQMGDTRAPLLLHRGLPREHSRNNHIKMFHRILTSLFSRISCFASGSTSTNSASSPKAPKSGPLDGRGSRLCKGWMNPRQLNKWEQAKLPPFGFRWCHKIQ